MSSTALASAAVVCTAALAACGTASTPAAAPVTTAPPVTSAPTTQAPTTVTVPPTTAPYAPTVASTTAASAAASLLARWQAGDRAGASGVAAPDAVAALFAQPAKALQARGCSDGQPPVDCIYADRSSASGALYDLSVTRSAAGAWYVAAVTVETP